MRVIYLLILIIFSACEVKTIPLKGNYPKKPLELTAEKPFQQVWDKLIDLFAQKGIGIKIIDKSSGLIVAQNATLPVTHEDGKGRLVNPEAWVVSSQIYDPGARRYFYPETASVEWNVRIKDLQNGSTSINVNITNIVSATAVYTVSPIIAAPNVVMKNTEAVSTGKFEKMIAEYLSN